MRSFLACSLLFALALPAYAEPESLRIMVIDRGEADGSLILTPNGKWVVIDAGADDLQAKAMADVWNVDEVALAIISHRDRGHYGGMARILRDFSVQRVVMNVADCPGPVEDDRIRAIAAERGVPRQSFGSDTIVVDGVRFSILKPDPVDDACPSHEDDNSIVVRVEYGEFSMLFPGDAGSKERAFLMEHQPKQLDVDVLKASNHGAYNGVNGRVQGKSWLDYVKPSAVVISVAATRSSGLPQDAAMREYETVGADSIHCTSRHGTVRIVAWKDGRYDVTHQFDSDRSCRRADTGVPAKRSGHDR